MLVAVALVAGAGAASALFVDYLAERARERVASAVPEPIPVRTISVPAPPKAKAPAKVAVAAAEPAMATPKQVADRRWFAAEAAGRPDGEPSREDLFKAITPTADDQADLSAYAAGEDDPADESQAGQAVSALGGDAVPLPVWKPAKSSSKAAAGGRQGRTAQGVTMRASPKRGGRPLLTIPGKSPITIFGCKAWCEVAFNGKRGFIYKRFVSRS